MCFDASPCVQHYHAFVCSPACLYVLVVICMCYGDIPHMLGVWGASAHLSGFWCLSVHPVDVHYASSCTFLVVHYVSSPYFHGYDYYSSDCGVFWYVIFIISDHGSLFDGASAILGQCDVVLLPPLIPRCSGGVLGHPSVSQQQPPSLMPLQAYANYAIGFLVGFIFRVEAPTVLYIICLVSVWVSAFYFQVPCWIPYSSLGVQPLGFAPLQPLGVYLWQAYVLPGDDHQPIAGIHRVAAPSTTIE